MNDGVIGIVFSWVYVSPKEFGVVGSDMYTWGYKRFSQMLVGVLGQEEALPWARWCNKLHICIVLLSEFVSQNAWLPTIPPILWIGVWKSGNCV